MFVHPAGGLDFGRKSAVSREDAAGVESGAGGRGRLRRRESDEAEWGRDRAVGKVNGRSSC